MAIIMGPKNRVHLGKDVKIKDTDFFVTNSGHIWIDDYSDFGHHVNLLCGYHDYTVHNEKRFPYPDKGFDIKIGKGVLLCSCCIIIGPCTIGDNSIIEAGSVVVKENIQPDQFWAGDPARLIRKDSYLKPKERYHLFNGDYNRS